jgi:L-alanine-DL-glutamate epimerase-like enolase superfamily enzyme
MAVITSIETGAVNVPLKKATSFSNRTMLTRQFGLVRVNTAAGSGIGIAYIGTAGGLMFPLAVEHILAPALLGRDTCEVERLWSRMYQEALMQGRAGIVHRALSALDIALWDHNAREAGKPLHKFLGAYETDSIPAYASGGYYLDDKGNDKLAEEMAGYTAAGFTAVKMKTGRLSPDMEEGRLKAVREAVGDDVTVMMDANNAWKDVTEALQHVRRFEKYHPHFIEEPFLCDDIDSHSRLASLTSIPVATGEVESGRRRFKEILDKKAAAVLQPDVCVCGGITEWNRIVSLAECCGVIVYPHAWHDLHAPLAASHPNVPMCEMFTNDDIFNPGSLFDNRMQQKNGRLQLRQGPGLGFNFKEDLLAETAMSGKPGRSPWIILKQ